MTKLMIVESPAKCKTIEGYLGKDWIVKASSGHIRDLPVKEMGISFPDYRPHYTLNSKSRRNIDAIKKLLPSVDQVYLATDPDREGEAISWHLREVLRLKQYKRVSFNEITKKALDKALQSASDIDFNLVKAQEGRRVLDRLVGYSVSPAISNAYGSWITAGRVQSVAVRIVVEREIVIRDFVSNDYFEVFLSFKNDNSTWKAKWMSAEYLQAGQEYMQDEVLANNVATVRDLEITEHEIKPQSRRPPAPFITSTLQQAASSALKIAPKKCMQLAQQLKDEGLITYHRTDNPNLSDDGFTAIVNWLDNNGFSEDRVESMNTWKSKAGAQEGHEAVRPTDIELLPQKVVSTHLDKDIGKLYSIIWHRAVASQMKPADYSVTNVVLKSLTPICQKFPTETYPQFEAQGRKLLYSGYLKLRNITHEDYSQGNKDKEKDQVLPRLSEGENLKATDGQSLAKKTKPPGRYTEASLIKKLEDEGIGRPSTYASILDNISKRDYISIKKRMLFANELGFTIYNLLKDRFEFMELSYTRDIEKSLDDLAHGKKQYREVMGLVYQQLSKELEQIIDIKVEGVETHHCPKCEAKLRLIKNKFWGCSNHPDCSYSAKNVDGKPVERDINKDSNKIDIKCPTCHSGTLIKRIVKNGKNKGKEFHGCSIYACNHFCWVK